MSGSRARPRGGRPISALGLGFLAILFGAFTGPAALAQERDATPARGSSVAPGDRVRISTSTSAEPSVGWVDGVESDAILLVDEDGHSLATISRADIRRLERSRVRRSGIQRAAPGILAGGLVGFMVGAMTAEQQHCEPGSWFCPTPPKATASVVGLALGMIGGGLISRAIIPGDSWESASLPTLTAGTGRGGGYLSVRIPVGSEGR